MNSWLSIELWNVIRSAPCLCFRQDITHFFSEMMPVIRDVLARKGNDTYDTVDPDRN
jgi:hypothetical protein